MGRHRVNSHVHEVVGGSGGMVAGSFRQQDEVLHESGSHRVQERAVQQRIGDLVEQDPGEPEMGVAPSIA